MLGFLGPHALRMATAAGTFAPHVDALGVAWSFEDHRGALIAVFMDAPEHRVQLPWWLRPAPTVHVSGAGLSLVADKVIVRRTTDPHQTVVHLATGSRHLRDLAEELSSLPPPLQSLLSSEHNRQDERLVVRDFALERRTLALARALG